MTKDEEDRLHRVLTQFRSALPVSVEGLPFIVEQVEEGIDSRAQLYMRITAVVRFPRPAAADSNTLPAALR